VRILQRKERVSFEYDYHLLKRWLIKMTFNSARIHSSIDLFAYPLLLPYINGESTAAGRSTQLYIQLSYPGIVPPERLACRDLEHAPAIWAPSENRVGFMYFNAPGVGRKLLRAVHLRSYSFYLAFFAPSENPAVTKDFASVFQSTLRTTVLLLASRQRADLVCDGADAWESIYAARANSLIEG
jgi:hypothetical protein